MRKPESAWQDLYRDALFETDLQKALERIMLAQAAIEMLIDGFRMHQG